MSTRCNIKVVEGKDTLWFYRHSDGYPDGALPLLNKFMKYLEEGKIRDNLSQACGWLILLGAQEYGQSIEKLETSDSDSFNWKVGAIEPTTEQHVDIEYLYTIDLEKKTLATKEI